MATLRVDSLPFTLKPSFAASKYDEWRHYQAVWKDYQGGQKAVDVVAMRYRMAPAAVWLVEAKDFRQLTAMPRPVNSDTLPETVAEKVRDTIAGLKDASMRASDPDEKNHAARAVAAKTTRIVLHLEPCAGRHSRLFPTGFSASVLQKLKALVRHIDPHPLVVNISNSAGQVPWTVS